MPAAIKGLVQPQDLQQTKWNRYGTDVFLGSTGARGTTECFGVFALNHMGD